MENAIANVITSSNKLELNFKYNKIKRLEEADASFPTLVIGYYNAKSLISGFDILRKDYDGGKLWWTFSKTEKRAVYDIDIMKFSDTVVDNLVKGVRYELVDVISLDKKHIFSAARKFLSDKDKLVYNMYNKFLFAYVKDEKAVYGIPLTTLRFCGVDTRKIMKKVLRNKHNRMVDDINVIPASLRRRMGTNLHYQLVLYEYFC